MEGVGEIVKIYRSDTRPPNCFWRLYLTNYATHNFPFHPPNQTVRVMGSPPSRSQFYWRINLRGTHLIISAQIKMIGLLW